MTDSSIYLKLLDTHVPLKMLTNTEVKIHLKTWLTNGIMTSICQKDKLYRKFSIAKDC